MTKKLAASIFEIHKSNGNTRKKGGNGFILCQD